MVVDLWIQKKRMKCESGLGAVARLVTLVFAALGLSVAMLGQAEDGSSFRQNHNGHMK